MKAKGGRRRWVRWGWRVLAFLALLVVVLAAVLCTRPGRRLALRGGLYLVHRSIPGRVGVEQWTELSPHVIELRHVEVYDPMGNRVASLAVVRIELDLLRLASGRFVIDRVLISKGFVDLVDVQRDDRGIVAAFVDPHAPASQANARPLPYVRVDHIEVKDMSIRLPELVSGGPSELRDVRGAASFELDQSPRVVVRHLGFDMFRGQDPLGQVGHVEAKLGRAAEPSALALDATIAGVALHLDAEATLPPQPAWRDLPIRANLKIAQISAANLANLLQKDSFRTAFRGSLDVAFALSGTPRELDAEVRLNSAAGDLNLDAHLAEFKRLRFTLSAPGFVARELWSAAPAARIEANLIGTADLERAPDAIPVSFDVRGAQVDGEALPSVHLEATVTRTDLQELVLHAEDGKSKLDVAGRARFDGSGQLDIEAKLEPTTVARLGELFGKKVRGAVWVDARATRAAIGDIDGSAKIVGRDLAFSDVSLDSMDASLEMSGDPLAPTGRTRGTVRNLTFGASTISNVEWNVRRLPGGYEGTVSVGGPTFDGSVHAQMSRQHEGFLVTAAGQGNVDGRAVILTVRPTRLFPQGAIETEGIDLGVAGQLLTVRGRVAASSSNLVIDAEQVRLGALDGLLPATVGPDATVTVHAEMQGPPATPDVAFRASLNELRFGDAPGIDITATGRLGSSEGMAELVLVAKDAPAQNADALSTKLGASAQRGTEQGVLDQAHSGVPSGPRQLDLTIDAKTRFASDRPLAKAWLDGEHEVHIHVVRLEAGFLQNALSTPLGLRGPIRAYGDFRGSLSSPTLGWLVAGELTADSGESTSDIGLSMGVTPFMLEHAMVFRDGRWDAQLGIKDKRGPWIDLRGMLSLGEGFSFATLAQNAQRVPDESRWSFDMGLTERALSELPLPKAWGGLPPAALSADLHVQHDPKREPDAKAHVVLRQTKPFVDALGCQASDVELKSTLQMRAGALKAEVVAMDKDRELLRVEGSGNLGLASALRGGSPKLGRLAMSAVSKDLSLENLPFVCRRVNGNVTLHAAIDDPLGASPHAELKLDAKRLRVDSPPTGALAVRNAAAGSKHRQEEVASRLALDAHASLSVDSHRARARAALGAGASTSTLFAEIPVSFAHGLFHVSKSAPLRAQVRLAHLPIEPLLNPRGAISHATGTLDGQIDVAGTADKPRVKGTLTLERLAFTATDWAQPLRQIGGRIDFTDTRATLTDLVARDKDGVVKLNGQFDFGDRTHLTGDFRLHADHFPLRQQGQIVATTDVDARVATTITPDKTSVNVVLEQVDTWLESTDLRSGIDLDAHPDVVMLDGKGGRASRTTDREQSDEEAGSESLAPSPPRVIEVAVDARDRFWIKREDFAVKLSAMVRARIADTVRIDGDVRVDRGYLQLFGKVFDIQRGGTLTFTGSRQPDPTVRLEAVYQARGSGGTVKVKIAGRASAPELSFFVDERAVTAGDAMLVMFGPQRSTQTPTSASDQARSFVSGLTAGLLATAVRKKLGAAAPILMVDPGDSATSGRVRAGLELDSIVPDFLQHIITGVYFEGIVSNQKTSQNRESNVQGGALLELYFPHDLFTSGQYGPGTMWSFDFGWQR